MPELFEDHDAVKMDTDVVVAEQYTNPMIMAAIDGKLDAESIKMLIELSNKQEDRRAKQLFDENFARLRAALNPIVKTKINGAFNSKYAPLEDLQEPCDPIIFEHGFSYSWREEALPVGKRTWMDVNGYGYTKSNYFDTPPIEVNRAQNALQAQGIMSSYGQRYTFKAGFGLVTKDEDTDGQFTFDDGVKYSDSITFLKSAKTMDELAAAWKTIATALKDDQEGFKKMSKIKDERKKELAK